jgi:two-component system, LytTR family, sensor kinase
MDSINGAALINLLGFTTGAILYAMLLVMGLRRPSGAGAGRTFDLTGGGLILATSLLGLLWNLGALGGFGIQGFGLFQPFPLVIAVSFAALGFLPAVVAHSALLGGRDSGGGTPKAGWIKLAAYALGSAAAAMHLASALTGGEGVSDAGLRALTVGYFCLILALVIVTRRGRRGGSRAVWASALAVFAVSALHLSHHPAGGTEVWSIELLGHHASIPLALAILYQDYRFAFADIFLKRALALVTLIAVALGLYVFAAAPLLALRGADGQTDPRAAAALLGMWVATALAYPLIRRGAARFVDAVVLRRADYGELRTRIARKVASCDDASAVLDEVCRELTPALTASETRWTTVEGPPAHGSDGAGTWPDDEAAAGLTALGVLGGAEQGEAGADGGLVTLPERAPGTTSAIAFVPTAEPPHHYIIVGELAGGRRLLSDDIAVLEAVAVTAARRIDALRVAHERCEQVSREQEISKLATEAQLRALRAQVNPHFLFNALTTIGYLIKAAPDRALETLLKLTDLLRRVLNSTGEFSSLGEELKLIQSYLDIERARFEERLRVRVDVPPELLAVRLPSLLVQPLVENAIKHGVAPARAGGEVSISARLLTADGAPGGQAGELLSIVVSDTGVGASEIELARGRRRGVGLNNVEERLRGYCGADGSLRVESRPGAGTMVEIRLPAATGSARNAGRGLDAATAAERRGA